MATDLEICNSALLKLGADPITSIVAPIDNTKRAKLCAAHYDRVKNEFLASENPIWFFAIKYEVLTGSAVTDQSIGFDYAFGLPDGHIKTYKVGLYDDTEYQRYGDIIYANGSTLSLFYVAEIDTDEWPAYATKALAWELALELSYSLIQSNETEQRIKADMKDVTRDAKLANLREANRGDLVITEFTGARR